MIKKIVIPAAFFIGISIAALAEAPQTPVPPPPPYNTPTEPAQNTTNDPFPYVVYVSVRDSSITIRLRYKTPEKAQALVENLYNSKSVEKVVDDSNSVFVIDPTNIKMAFFPTQ